MQTLKPLLAAGILAAACAAQGAALTDEPFQAAPYLGAGVPPSEYSFADLYRLASSGPALAGFAPIPAANGPVRVAARQDAAPAQFTIAAVPEPKPWMLVLAGLAACAWVARRRLRYGF